MAWLRRGSVNASLSSGGCRDVTSSHFSRANKLFREKYNSRLNLICFGGLLVSGELFSKVQHVGDLRRTSVDFDWPLVRCNSLFAYCTLQNECLLSSVISSFSFLMGSCFSCLSDRCRIVTILILPHIVKAAKAFLP